MKVTEQRLFASVEDAKRFTERVAKRFTYAQKLRPDALAEIGRSLDGLSVEQLFGRAARRRNLNRLGDPTDQPLRGLVAGQWAARRYAKGEGIHIRGIRMPIPELVTQLGRELNTPLDTFHWSLFALPAGCHVPELHEDGDLFLFHVRGGICAIRSKKSAYDLAAHGLAYVPADTSIELEAREEALVLRVRIAFEPTWKVMVYTLADTFSRTPELHAPAIGLYGEGAGGVATRKRLSEALDAARERLASWDVAGVVRDYRAVADGRNADGETVDESDETDASDASGASDEADAADAADAARGADEAPAQPAEADTASWMFRDAQWGITGVARRPDDIHIATFKRSGTTWMQMIMYQLLTDGDLDAIGHMYEFSPYPDYELRILCTADRLNALPSPRVIKSHLPFEHIHSNLGKYIHVARNGMDVAVSSFHHHRGVGNGPVPFDVYVDEFLTEGRWFREVAGWWEKRHLPNVLFLTFRDLKMDLAGTVAKIARFCELDLSADKLATVVERSGFANMKRHEKKFDHNEGVRWLMEQEGAGSAFIRNGGMSEGKTRFDEAQRRRFREVYQQMLGHTDIRLDE